MSANDQLPLFPEAALETKSSDNHEPPALPPTTVTQSGDGDEDDDDFTWACVLEDHFQSSTKLAKAFDVPADAILRWAAAGYFSGLRVKKGKRDIQLFNRVGVAKFLMKPEAGVHQLKCVTVRLSALKVAPAIYARAKPTPQNCATLIQAVRNGIKLGSLVAIRVEGDLIVVDGRRRHFAIHYVNGATDPLVEVFILPGNLVQAKAFAAMFDTDAGAGPAKKASAYFEKLVEDTPILKAQILANKVKSPTFGRAFGFPRSTMDRCFKKLGWVTDRKPKLSLKSQEKAKIRKAEKEALEAIRAIRRAPDDLARAEAINHASRMVDAYRALFDQSYGLDASDSESAPTM